MNIPDRILMVEENPIESALMVAALAEAGITNVIDVVRDGEEALDYLHKRGKYAERSGGYPILILLDLGLPKIDGREVLKQLKTTEKLSCIPVVVVTGSSAERDIAESYAYGANSYVVKPVDSQGFFDVMKNLSIYWTMTSAPPPVDECKVDT